MVTKKLMHLHWSFRLSSAEQKLKETTTGVAECGVKGLTKDQLTIKRSLVTCPKCKLAKLEVPKPVPRKVVTAPDASKAMPNGKWPWPPGATIEVIAPSNPITPRGTPKHKRWQMLWDHDGKAWEKYRDAGGHPLTLSNAVHGHYVKIVA